MELNTLHQALLEAQAGLKAIDVDFELLRSQKERLERLIGSLREVLESSTPLGSGALALATQPAPAGTAVFGLSSKEIPLWEAALGILSAFGKPMTVPEIALSLEKATNSGISPESVRVAMFRKPQYFARLSHGTYGLKIWNMPGEEKEAPIAEAS
jgi:hypothetical protein